MTVKKLIEKLKEIPEDYVVKIFSSDEDYLYRAIVDIVIFEEDKEIWLTDYLQDD